MKKFLLTVTVLSLQCVYLNAQCPDDVKRACNTKINAAFVEWGKSWWIDNYVSRSSTITSCEFGNYDDELKIAGRFDYIRSGSKHNIPFTAKIQVQEDGTLVVDELCYDDTKYKGGNNCR